MASSAYDLVVLADSPSVYYKMQDASGTSLVDSSVNANTGTASATGITYSQAGAIRSDPNSRTMLFDGVAGLWRSTINLSAGHTITFECWASIASLGATGQALLELGSGFPANAGGVIIQWDGSSANWQQFLQDWAPAASSQSYVGYTATNPTIGAFHHLVFAWDFSLTGAAAQNKLYVDGVAQTGTVGTSSNSSQTVFNGTFTGMATGGGSALRSGNLGNVAIYPTALTATQAKAHYMAASPYPPRIRGAQQAVNRTAVW